MKNTRKKGFTIVELVIVIAIIAILAAVLIPTFSNIIKKANLSADKQAVREMNEALAQWEAANGYPVVKDVEQAQMILKVMQILADAGYNTDNWTCLTQGYEVYWYKNDNRMILYNSTEGAIEYPDEYVGTKTMVKAENGFFLYNYNHVQAQQFDISLGSSTAKGNTSFSSVSVQKADGALNSNATNNISALTSAVSNANVKSAITSSFGASSSSNIYMYASREIVSSDSNAYASLQVSAVGTTENPVILKSNGELVENLYYIAVVTNTDATPQEIASAQAAAGQYVYNVFDKITAGTVDDNVTIVVAPGTVLDVSACEWAPCKFFQGYFGTTDSSNPIVINGARLTPATGYAQTVRFDGDSSKYFVTGFFGTVYGDTTIENVTFQNLSINSPANDYELSTTDITGGKTSSRNTVGIIGGIVDYRQDTILTSSEASELGLNTISGRQATIANVKYYKDDKNNKWWRVNNETVEANVTLRNIKVESTCSVTSLGCAGGLVGYIGSCSSYAHKSYAYPVTNSSVTIENCTVSTKVSSLDTKGSISAYGTVGGIVGFMCRADNWTCTIKNCEFNGTADGYGGVSGLVGDNQSGKVVFEGTNKTQSATLNGNSTAKGVAAISTTGKAEAHYENNGIIEYKSGIATMGTPALLTKQGTLTAK